MQANLTIRRDAKGGYYVRPYLGTNEVTGKKVQPFHALEATTMAEAEREAAEWYATIMGNPLLSAALDDYVKNYLPMDHAASTVRTYRSAVRTLKPFVSRIRVRDLTTKNCSDINRELLEHGGRGGRPLSPNTALKIISCLSGAYNHFMRLGLATINPTLTASKPSPVHREAKSLDDYSARVVRDALARMLEGKPMRASGEGGPPGVFERNAAMAMYLALYLGVRVGEACAIRRCDINATRGFVHVCGTVIEDGGLRRSQTTKGKKSRNVSATSADIARIRAHMAWQDTLFGAGSDTTIVSADGGLCRPTSVSHFYTGMKAALGLPKDSKFHTLRHTQASFLMANGVDLKTVSERLGHANTSTTANIYAHVIAGRDQAAASTFGTVMGGL